MFLGIDESNHGKFPEIFVGMYSPNISLLKRGCYEKQRRIANRKFLDIPYKHLIFSQTNADVIGKVNIPVIAIAELAKYVDSVMPLNTIYVDGELKSDQLATIERLVYAFNKKAKLKPETHLDTSMRLVNEADNRANFLHRYYAKYSDKGGRKIDYVHKLITPRLEDYYDYLL